METQDQLEAFARNLYQEVIRLSEMEGSEVLRAHAFTQYMIDELVSAGELQDGVVCYHRSRGAEISGYYLTDDGANLDLFLTVYQQTLPSVVISRSDIETAFRRLAGFLTRTLKGYHTSLEEASPVFDMALTIHEARKQIERIRFFLFTDGIAKLEFKLDGQIDGAPIHYHIWDIRRLFRYVQAGRRQEDIEIDFQKEYGCTLPCLMAPQTADNYRSYLVILPGTVLASIYERYGARLLELNVRSFLQARGKVNQGIRRTIVSQPERFLAYNNGLSATARDVQLVNLPDGAQSIRSIRGLQIVNGGQTTASIHYAVKKDKADVSHVYIQVKLTVVDEDRLKEIVPLISRYANSQNTVSEADFSANDAFHVRVEELSRTVWAPATGKTQRQTKWFYERARGQYQDALALEGTPARMRHFKLTHPNVQRFTKTDLAKFEHSWEQLPHLVSFGAQKNFVEFTLRLSKQDQAMPDQAFFKRLIGKAILFRRSEKLVSEQNFGGYRANIVTYTISLLVHKTNARINLERLWLEQDISPAIAEAIKTLSHSVHKVITNPSRGENITEWCKKKSCWDSVREIDVAISPELHDELVSLEQLDLSDTNTYLTAQSEEDREQVAAVRRISAKTWFELSEWAKEANQFHPWERNTIYNLGQIVNKGQEPSGMLARQGLKLLQEAELSGYTFESENESDL